jgi:hypothetical protein
MGLIAIVLFVALLLVLGVLVFPRYHPHLHARTTAFRHSEPWIASAFWGGGLVIMFLALGSYWQDLPEPVQKLAAPVIAPSPAATMPATPAPTAANGTAKAPPKAKPTQRPPSPPPAAAATPSPSPSPLPSPLVVTITSAKYGSIAATTAPGAQCTAAVALPNGQTINKEKARTASSTGRVSWTYTTQPGVAGTATATVACSLNGRTGSATKTFTITSVTPSPSPTLQPSPSPTPTG